ncbi:Capsular polysaccharide biosynthesis protein [Peptoclostridium litorale DSM 5388]|uniref:Chain length determinant family protein n=1 Tax=Peptoclostridium litorale DSM 5388 TaxID=1121324 RepID=A0A069RD41_PEPLI|nr:Wzz/FepE/Etk N-terminal domain-containing protein [Peptoclostridium litorale]KDR94673.1 chain length determinant family protein [Peptoclostridium litorale DSM 5388]SIO29937.1 Capsular polysaccharide biosynthesis protein [Peptoclostridium litorale DSM 5388]
MEETIDIREYFEMVRKRIWMIIGISAFFMAVSAAVSFLVLEPVYQTSTTLMVNKAKDDIDKIIDYQDVMLSQKLVNTYGEIAKSKVVMSKVAGKLNLKMSTGQLMGKVSVTPVKDTEIMRITVSDNDPALAVSIADITADVFMEEVSRIMNVENIQIIDRAEVPAGPVKPNKNMNVAIAGVLGVMLGLFITFMIEYLDNTIKTPEDVEKNLGIQVIGMIPVFEQIEK